MISEALKLKTRNDHDDLEGGFNLKDFTSSSYKLVSVLKAFYGFYIPVEVELKKFESEFKSAGINLEERLKSHLLENDLEDQGISANSFSHIPRATEIPQIKSLSDAFAVLYVLEGSTMGGQIISKELAKSDLSSIYFNPYKEKTMPMWMQFKNALNQLPESEEDQMVQTARSTFSSLGKWLRSST